jgi:hypothetical protein
MNAPAREAFRVQLARQLDAMDQAGLSPEDKASHVIRVMVERLSALVIHFGHDDPACVLLRQEIRDIQAGAR